jgi:hypothetical protein
MFVSSLALTARYPSDDLRAFGSLNTRDYGGFVSRADRLLHEKLRPPAGYSLKWSGEYEFELRANERLKIILPIDFRTIALEKPSSSPSAPRISCNVAFRPCRNASWRSATNATPPITSHSASRPAAIPSRRTALTRSPSMRSPRASWTVSVRRGEEAPGGRASPPNQNCPRKNARGYTCR